MIVVVMGKEDGRGLKLRRGALSIVVECLSYGRWIYDHTSSRAVIHAFVVVAGGKVGLGTKIRWRLVCKVSISMIRPRQISDRLFKTTLCKSILTEGWS